MNKIVHRKAPVNTGNNKDEMHIDENISSQLWYIQLKDDNTIDILTYESIKIFNIYVPSYAQMSQVIELVTLHNKTILNCPIDSLKK